MNRYFACIWHSTDLPSYSGGQYNLEYVANLSGGIRRHDPDGQLTILADAQYYLPCIELGVATVPFSGDDCGGWSKMLEMFRPDLWPEQNTRHVCMGLDTVIMGDPTWLFRWGMSAVGLPLDPYHDPMPCNAVVSYDRHGAEQVWGRYMEEKSRSSMAKCLFGGKPSEMTMLRRMYFEQKWIPLEREASRLLSYKVHVKNGICDNPSIVYFHGRPKPHELPDDDKVRLAWSGGA